MSKFTAAPDTSAPFGELPGLVGRLEQARNEQKRYRFWLGVATFCLGAIGIVALGMFVDWMWEVPAWLRAWLCRRSSALRFFFLSAPAGRTVALRPRRTPSGSSRSWGSEFERSCSMPIRSRAPCRPRPDCSGAGPSDGQADRSTRLSKAGPVAYLRAQGDRLVPRVDYRAHNTVREPFDTNRRLANAALAGALHDGEGRAR